MVGPVGCPTAVSIQSPVHSHHPPDGLTDLSLSSVRHALCNYLQSQGKWRLYGCNAPLLHCGSNPSVGAILIGYTPAQQNVITEALNLIQERAATKGNCMTSPSQTFDYFRLFYAERQEREHFALMLLDRQHKVLECSVVFSGTIDGASIYQRRAPAHSTTFFIAPLLHGLKTGATSQA
jgi:hypothetical protein